MKNRTSGFILNIIIAAILSAGAAVFPYASVLIMVASAIFFAVCAYTHKTTETVVVLISSLTAILVTKCFSSVNADNIFTSLSLFCLTSLSGTVTGMMMRGKNDFRMVIAGGTFASLASFLIDFAVLKFYHGINLGEELINKPIADFFEVYSGILASTNIGGAENFLEITGDMQWYVQQAMATVVPCILIIICALFTYVTFLAARKFIFKKHGVVMSEYPHFWELKMPRSASLILSILFLITFFMDASAISGALSNIVIIFCALYFMCGLSVVDFFLRKRRIHWVLRIIIYIIGFVLFSIISLILPILNITSILLFTGVTDGMFNFRRLAK